MSGKGSSRLLPEQQSKYIVWKWKPYFIPPLFLLSHRSIPSTRYAIPLSMSQGPTSTRLLPSATTKKYSEMCCEYKEAFSTTGPMSSSRFKSTASSAKVSPSVSRLLYVAGKGIPILARTWNWTLLLPCLIAAQCHSSNIVFVLNHPEIPVTTSRCERLSPFPFRLSCPQIALRTSPRHTFNKHALLHLFGVCGEECQYRSVSISLFLPRTCSLGNGMLTRARRHFITSLVTPCDSRVS